MIFRLNDRSHCREDQRIFISSRSISLIFLKLGKYFVICVCIYLINNDNFIICTEYKKLDSLPRKIAGKLVVAGQDKYTNNIY